MTQAAQQQAAVAGYRVWTEPNERRVRVFVAGQAIADSSRTVYLFETGHLPVYYLPRADVRFDLLEPSGYRTTAPTKATRPRLDVRQDLLVPTPMQLHETGAKP